LLTIGCKTYANVKQSAPVLKKTGVFAYRKLFMGEAKASPKLLGNLRVAFQCC